MTTTKGLGSYRVLIAAVAPSGAWTLADDVVCETLAGALEAREYIVLSGPDDAPGNYVWGGGVGDREWAVSVHCFAHSPAEAIRQSTEAARSVLMDECGGAARWPITFSHARKVTDII